MSATTPDQRPRHPTTPRRTCTARHPLGFTCQLDVTACHPADGMRACLDHLGMVRRWTHTVLPENLSPAPGGPDAG